MKKVIGLASVISVVIGACMLDSEGQAYELALVLCLAGIAGLVVQEWLFEQSRQQKITRYLKNSEKPQPNHNKTTLDSEFDEILRKEQERIEKEKQDLGQSRSNSDNRDSGRDVAAELLKCKGRDRYIHPTKPS